MNEKLKGLKVGILVTDGFEQVELTEPREALNEAGAATLIVAPEEGSVQGMNHADKADTFSVDMKTSDAKPEDFDAILLPGGVVNADQLRMDDAARELVRAIDEAGKPIAVICHGPWLLVSAGLVRGRKMTSYHTVQDDIRNAGGQWVDQEVVRDRNWVSSRKPDDLPAFNRA
ncbi:MAG: type 1 glutamine amidotransferase domain-containing protein, partial [Thermoanaerobaculia bacterium]|nr:type 1 glutamine amidotransferase domain-containing protein [Thermoanaerobaculia bacterium]